MLLPFSRRGPLAIGALALPSPVILAPMSGITDAPFRRCVERLGAALVVSEMTASADLARRSPDALLRAEGRGLGLHVVQLAGCAARWMAEGARIAEASGAHAIDINMGCPARQVTGGQSGAALMRDLDHALALIEATVGAVSVPVTLKMRLGWDERSINAPELARRAEGAGVRLIAVHARTRCQFYRGRAAVGELGELLLGDRVDDRDGVPAARPGSQRVDRCLCGHGPPSLAVVVPRGGAPWWCGCCALAQQC